MGHIWAFRRFNVTWLFQALLMYRTLYLISACLVSDDYENPRDIACVKSLNKNYNSNFHENLSSRYFLWKSRKIERFFLRYLPLFERQRLRNLFLNKNKILTFVASAFFANTCWFSAIIPNLWVNYSTLYYRIFFSISWKSNISFQLKKMWCHILK